MNISDEQKACDHDIAWCPFDELDGMCRKCNLYVMKPNCIAETNAWLDKTFGDGALCAPIQYLSLEEMREKYPQP